MPKGNFRKGWNEVAGKQKLPRRLLMWSIAGNDELMDELEHAASDKSKEQKLGALPWSEIIALILPMLLKIISERIKP